MIFFLYLLNHLSITLTRAYFRSVKLKYVYFENDENMGSFKRGIERRWLKMTTFFLAFALTIVEFALLELVSN